MVQAVENFPFFESWRKHRNRQLSEAWRKVFQELSQKGAQVGEFHCVGGGFPEVCVSEQPLTYNALRSTVQCHSGRQSWAMCFNRIVDVNNTEDPDADGAPPLEAAGRHERTLEGVGPIP
jgi:hypothetical protein